MLAPGLAIEISGKQKRQRPQDDMGIERQGEMRGQPSNQVSACERDQTGRNHNTLPKPYQQIICYLLRNVKAGEKPQDPISAFHLSTAPEKRLRERAPLFRMVKGADISKRAEQQHECYIRKQQVDGFAFCVNAIAGLRPMKKSAQEKEQGHMKGVDEALECRSIYRMAQDNANDAQSFADVHPQDASITLTHACPSA